MEIHLQCYIIGAWHEALKRKRLHRAPKRWLQAQQCGWKGTEMAVSHRYGVTSERGYQLVSLSPPSQVSEGVAAWLLLVAFSMQTWQRWQCPGLASPAGGKGKPGDTWGRASPILTQKKKKAWLLPHSADFSCLRGNHVPQRGQAGRAEMEKPKEATAVGRCATQTGPKLWQ